MSELDFVHKDILITSEPDFVGHITLAGVSPIHILKKSAHFCRFCQLQGKENNLEAEESQTEFVPIMGFQFYKSQVSSQKVNNYFPYFEAMGRIRFHSRILEIHVLEQLYLRYNVPNSNTSSYENNGNHRRCSGCYSLAMALSYPPHPLHNNWGKVMMELLLQRRSIFNWISHHNNHYFWMDKYTLNANLKNFELLQDVYSYWSLQTFLFPRYGLDVSSAR